MPPIFAVDRGRVETDLAPSRSQPLHCLGTDAGLQADLRALWRNVAPIPAVAGDDQHRVADGLAGGAGAWRRGRKVTGTR